MMNEQILRFIQLIHRRQQIILYSINSLAPKYGNELNKIDVELAKLRTVIYRKEVNNNADTND